ncbi:MAG TPA: DinB family protein [Thermoanaerobaculia bacterium]
MILQMEWADAQLWRAVLAAADRIDDRTRELVVHVHQVQHAFLGVWRGEPLDLRDPSSFGSLEAIRDWGRAAHLGIQAFLDSADDDAKQRPVVMPWATPEMAVPTLGETFVQVPMHSMYHRGQVNARLRTLGGEPPLVDFIFWVWSGKPRAAWD